MYLKKRQWNIQTTLYYKKIDCLKMSWPWSSTELVLKAPMGGGSPIMCQDCGKPAISCTHSKKKKPVAPEVAPDSAVSSPQPSQCKHCPEKCFCVATWSKREKNIRSQMTNTEFTKNAIIVFAKVLETKASEKHQKETRRLTEMIDIGTELLSRRDLFIQISDKGVLTERVLYSLEKEFADWEAEATAELELLFCGPPTEADLSNELDEIEN
jgi:hypothetical protein